MAIHFLLHHGYASITAWFGDLTDTYIYPNIVGHHYHFSEHVLTYITETTEVLATDVCRIVANSMRGTIIVAMLDHSLKAWFRGLPMEVPRVMDCVPTICYRGHTDRHHYMVTHNSRLLRKKNGKLRGHPYVESALVIITFLTCVDVAQHIGSFLNMVGFTSWQCQSNVVCTGYNAGLWKGETRFHLGLCPCDRCRSLSDDLEGLSSPILRGRVKIRNTWVDLDDDGPVWGHQEDDAEECDDTW